MVTTAAWLALNSQRALRCGTVGLLLIDTEHGDKMKPRDAGTIAEQAAFANRWFSSGSVSKTFIPLLCATVLVGLIASAASLFASAPSVAHNANADDLDRSVKPGDDFYRYANGGWLKTAAI